MSGQGMHGVGATSMSRSALETEIAALKQQVSYSSKQELPYQLRQLSIHMHIKDNTPENVNHEHDLNFMSNWA